MGKKCQQAKTCKYIMETFEVTKYHMWDIFAFWVAVKILISLGFVSWMGIFITWPLSTLAYACFYRKLVADHVQAEHQFNTTI